jgi:hypothetical protein
MAEESNAAELKDWLIEDFPVELRWRLKTVASHRKTTIKEYVKKTIREAVEKVESEMLESHGGDREGKAPRSAKPSGRK